MAFELPSAVIFDLDGCLVDSEVLSIGAITDEIRAMGVAGVTFDDIRERFLGVSMTVICDEVASLSGVDEASAFVDRVELRLFERYRSELRRIDGATGLLDALRSRGIPMAIATGGSVRRMHTTLEIAGLTPWFAGTGFSADQVARGKPAPDLFLFAAQQLGVDPARCAVMEDSPHGIAGAVAAGMRAIGFVGGTHLDPIRDAHAARLSAAGAVSVETDITGVTRALLEESSR